MRIDRIEVFRVEMPLIYPFRTAFSNASRIGSVLVKITSGDAFGWGEATPWSEPGYSAECAPTCEIMIRDLLAPLLVGQEVQSGEDLQQRLAPSKGNFFAKAALDLAW